MRKIIYSITFLLIVICFNAKAQQVFWTETFGTGCNAGQGASVVATPSNGAWAITSFSLPFMNGPNANQWFISAQEQGQAIGVCGGITCGGPNDRSLHLGANVTIPTPNVDPGASYLGGAIAYTNKRAETPVVDCTGHNYLQLSFKYFEKGVPGNDYCDIEYSANGGVTWNTLTTIAPSNNTLCPTTGMWSFYSIGLPTTLSNNNNVKIGFHWYNNDPTGGNLSIAIDNIQLSELTMTTTSNVDCLSANGTASIVNNAVGNTSYTWSAIPNTVTFSPVNNNTTTIQYPSNGTYTVLVFGSELPNGIPTSTALSVATVTFITTPSVFATSTDPILCTGSSATLTGAGATSYTWANGPSTTNYVITPSATTIYTVIGKNGYCISSYTIQQLVDPCTALAQLALSGVEGMALNIFPNPFSSEINFTSNEQVEITFINTLGQIVKQVKFKDQVTIQTSELPNGIYMLFIKRESGVKTSRIVKN